MTWDLSEDCSKADLVWLASLVLATQSPKQHCGGIVFHRCLSCLHKRTFVLMLVVSHVVCCSVFIFRGEKVRVHMMMLAQFLCR